MVTGKFVANFRVFLLCAGKFDPNFGVLLKQANFGSNLRKSWPTPTDRQGTCFDIQTKIPG